MDELNVSRGSPYPLGANFTGTGVNFAVFSRNGTRVLLDIYAHEDDSEPCSIIDSFLSMV